MQQDQAAEKQARLLAEQNHAAAVEDAQDQEMPQKTHYQVILMRMRRKTSEAG